MNQIVVEHTKVRTSEGDAMIAHLDLESVKKVQVKVHTRVEHYSAVYRDDYSSVTVVLQ